jgi:hypothetical protein
VRRISLDLLIALSETCPEFRPDLDSLFVTKLSDTDLYIRKLLANWWRRTLTKDTIAKCVPHDIWLLLTNQLGNELDISADRRPSQDIFSLLDSYDPPVKITNIPIFRGNHDFSSLDEVLSDILTPSCCECIELDLD